MSVHIRPFPAWFAVSRYKVVTTRGYHHQEGLQYSSRYRSYILENNNNSGRGLGPMEGVILTTDTAKNFNPTPDIEGKNARHPTLKIYPDTSHLTSNDRS